MPTETELLAALNTHLNGMAGRPPVAWENVGLVQVPDTYLSQHLLPAQGETVGREVGGGDVLAGVYQVTINTPKSSGVSAQLTELARIRARFVRSAILLEGGTRVVLQKIWANSPIVDDTHFRTPVSIRYRAL